jgi:hypothetical protein
VFLPISWSPPRAIILRAGALDVVIGYLYNLEEKVKGKKLNLGINSIKWDMEKSVVIST